MKRHSQTVKQPHDVWFWNFTNNSFPVEHRPGPWLPIFQTYPVFFLGNNVWTNYNGRNAPRVNTSYLQAQVTQTPILEFLVNLNPDSGLVTFESTLLHPIFRHVPELDGNKNNNNNNAARDSQTEDDDRSGGDVVAYLHMAIDWVQYFQNLLPAHVQGIVAVLKSPCQGLGYDGVTVSYEIQGLNAVPLGLGDRHDTRYDHMVVSAPFVQLQQRPEASNQQEGSDNVQDTCIPQLDLYLYPSKASEESYQSNQAMHNTLAVVALFALTALVFLIYDATVRRRQWTVMTRVQRQQRLVSNMFPTELRRRVFMNRKKKTDRQRGTDSEDDNETGMGDNTTLASRRTRNRRRRRLVGNPQEEEEEDDFLERHVDEDEEFFEQCLFLDAKQGKQSRHRRRGGNTTEDGSGRTISALANRFFQTTVIHAVGSSGWFKTMLLCNRFELE